MKKKIGFLKVFVLLFSSSFLIYLIKEDFFLIEKIVKEKKFNFFILLVIYFSLSNIQSLRYFVSIKNLSFCNIDFITWKNIFFGSSIMNIAMPLSGHLYRSSELKKYNFTYRSYLGLNYYIAIFVIIINLFLISLEILFIKSNLILLISFPIIFLCILLITPYFLSKINKIFQLKVFFKKKFFNYLTDTINIIISYSKNTKNLLIFICFTFIIHIFEICAFGYAALIVLEEINLKEVIYIFAITFLLNRIQVISGIFGVNEILTGLIAFNFGFQFSEGVLIQLLLRLSIYISQITNYLLYLFIRYFFRSYIHKGK